MKTRSLLFILFFMIGAAFTTNAQLIPGPSCTNSHNNLILSTGTLAVETCQNEPVGAAAIAHCNAIGQYGYRWVIENGSFSRTYVTHTPNWSGTCHDLRVGYNSITLYYRSSPGGTWQQYATGGITLTCVDCID